MLAAAGIVVTEISTPVSAPDFEVVRDSTPATPAQNATKNEKESGLEITTAKAVVRLGERVGRQSVHLKISEARNPAAMPTGKPTGSATNERSADSARRSTTATQKPPADRTPGPSTIAPTSRIGVSRRIATVAMSVASDHEHHEAPVSVGLLRGQLLDLLPYDRVAGSPGAARSAASAARESACRPARPRSIRAPPHRAPAGRRSRCWPPRARRRRGAGRPPVAARHRAARRCCTPPAPARARASTARSGRAARRSAGGPLRGR